MPLWIFDGLFAKRGRLFEADLEAIFCVDPRFRVNCWRFSLSDIDVSGEEDRFAKLFLIEARAISLFSEFQWCSVGAMEMKEKPAGLAEYDLYGLK